MNGAQIGVQQVERSGSKTVAGKSKREVPPLAE